MTYFGFLAIFLGTPIAALMLLTWRDRRRQVKWPDGLAPGTPWLVLALHVLIALIYTTPWDNYLVATGVWWYDPALVTGITLGWVPIEEYTFFVVQPIFTGLWLLFWLRRERPSRTHSWENNVLRRRTLLVGGLVWGVMVAILLAGWKPGTYLALELGWALPPIMLQLYFGADILWQRRRLLALAILPTTLYLAGADALAIRSGTWTIDPQQSLDWLIGGILPLEELVFFLITNVLVVFGMTLALAPESGVRLARMRNWVMALRKRPLANNANS